jgi:hypothetical protein
MRPVMHGVLYRGGVQRPTGLQMDIPLSAEALITLCEEGFGTALYLPSRFFYPNNAMLYHDARVNLDEMTGIVSATCLTRTDGEKNTLTYYRLPAHEDNFRQFEELLYDAMQPNGQPIYAHCRGGMHRAGLVSAISLVQYCGLDSTPYLTEDGNVQTDTFGGELSDASTYWLNNAGTILYEPRDPKNDKYDEEANEWFNVKMSQINSFDLYPDLTISSELKEAICPSPDPVDPENKRHFED